MFRVCTSRFEAVEDKRDLRQVEKLLNLSLQSEHHDFAPLLAKAYKQSWKREQPAAFLPRVFYDNSPLRHTLIEIMVPDRLGLLYDLLHTISDAGYEIVSARITTEIGAAIDSFYITGIEGAKIPNDGSLDRLKLALREVAAKRVS
jgi:[protein-PII] uridylyltransferase